MASARIDMAVVQRMVSEILETISGTTAGKIPVRQLGEPEPETPRTVWGRLLGMTCAGIQRQRQGAGGPDEADSWRGEVRIGVCVTPDQASPAAIGTAVQIGWDAFDELTKIDTTEATAANRHQMDFGRCRAELVNEPDPERGIRIAELVCPFTVIRAAGTSRERYLT